MPGSSRDSIPQRPGDQSNESRRIADSERRPGAACRSSTSYRKSYWRDRGGPPRTTGHEAPVASGPGRHHKRLPAPRATTGYPINRLATTPVAIRLRSFTNVFFETHVIELPTAGQEPIRFVNSWSRPHEKPCGHRLYTPGLIERQVCTPRFGMTPSSGRTSGGLTCASHRSFWIRTTIRRGWSIPST